MTSYVRPPPSIVSKQKTSRREETNNNHTKNKRETLRKKNLIPQQQREKFAVHRIRERMPKEEAVVESTTPVEYVIMGLKVRKNEASQRIPSSSFPLSLSSSSSSSCLTFSFRFSFSYSLHSRLSSFSVMFLCRRLNQRKKKT